jgi:hypothetical protein
MLLSHCDPYVTHLLARSRDRDLLLLPLFVLDGIRLPFFTLPMKSDCLSLSHTHVYTHTSALQNFGTDHNLDNSTYSLER